MACPQDPPRRFLPFGNPFRRLLPKGSSLPPKMLNVLSIFEENLAGRLKKLKPKGTEDLLSFSWMRNAIKSLCEIHAEIKLLVTALELPIIDWDDMWIDAYFDDSLKFLDICTTLNHEILRLKRGRLHLACAFRDLESTSPNHFINVWEEHMTPNNSKLDKIFFIMDSLAETLELPKIKNSPKEKVLLQAMYGLKAATLFICSVFAAAFFGTAECLVDVRVLGTCLWAEAFVDLQTRVNSEIRNMELNRAGALLKELEAVETGVKKLYDSSVEGRVLENMKLDFEESMEKVHEGLNELGNEVHGFFRGVVLGRNALLGNLRRVGYASIQDEDFVRELKARVFGGRSYNKPRFCNSVWNWNYSFQGNGFSILYI